MRKVKNLIKHHPWWAIIIFVCVVGGITGNARVAGIVIAGILVIRLLFWVGGGLWRQKDKEMWEKDMKERREILDKKR